GITWASTTASIALASRSRCRARELAHDVVPNEIKFTRKHQKPPTDLLLLLNLADTQQVVLEAIEFCAGGCAKVRRAGNICQVGRFRVRAGRHSGIGTLSDGLSASPRAGAVSLALGK